MRVPGHHSVDPSPQKNANANETSLALDRSTLWKLAFIGVRFTRISHGNSHLNSVIGYHHFERHRGLAVVGWNELAVNPKHHLDVDVA